MGGGRGDADIAGFGVVGEGGGRVVGGESWGGGALWKTVGE